jgi:SAM-dependent methyltransferase
MSDDAVALCLAGRISAEVALARLLLDGTTPERVARHVAECRDDGNRHWHRLAALVAAGRDGMAAVSALVHVAGADHTTSAGDAPEAIARIAALFDRAVAVAPLASVAAYSLDNPAILDAATGELLAWLVGEGLVGPQSDVLDLGCGIGRVGAALAPICASVLGLDVSPGMLEEARQRHAGIGNLRFQHTGGLGLPDLPAASFDLILAVDSFPYLVQAGGNVAERHVADAARLLRPGGALAILNLSYRGDDEADRADVASWAALHKLTVTSCGNHPFRLWDATAFVLRKPT